jgi:sporulation protein YlmC with PRC-barrel domain
MFRRSTLWIAAAALSLTSPALAQNKDKDKDKDHDNRSSQREERREQRASASGDILQASKVLGLRVETTTTNNEMLGVIDNIAVDSRDGRAVYAIINSKNVPNMRDKLTAVPFPALRFGENVREPARINITTEKFEQQSAFNSDGWPTIGEQNWGKILYRTYGLEDEWNRMSADSDRDHRNASDNNNNADRLPLMKITDLIGRDVRGTQREDLGKVEDLALDVRRDRVLYAALSTDRGNNNKFIAVPFSMLDVNATQKTIVCRADRDRLKNAPMFASSDFSQLADSNFTQRVNKHFGVDDNVVYGYHDGQNDSRDRDNRDRDNNDDSRLRGWEPSSEYNNRFSSGTRETITGRITAIEHVTPTSGMSEGVALRINSSENQNVIVHLGPSWFIDHQQNQFKEGDQVEVQGSRVSIDNRNVVLAQLIRRGDRVMVLRTKDGWPMWAAWRANDENRNREGDRNSNDWDTDYRHKEQKP